MKRKLDSERTASARPLLAARNAVSISSGARTSRYRCRTPNATAARSVSPTTCALPGSVEFPRTATRERLGTISFQKLQLFSAYLWGKRGQSSNVPTWPRKTGNEPVANRVKIKRHDDGARNSFFLGER